jgi:hypothetical protein
MMSLVTRYILNASSVIAPAIARRYLAQLAVKLQTAKAIGVDVPAGRGLEPTHNPVF